jgi:hypothetical protein
LTSNTNGSIPDFGTSEDRKRDAEHKDTALKRGEQNDTDLQEADRELLYDAFPSAADNGSGQASSNAEDSPSQCGMEAGPNSTHNKASKG